MSEEVVKCIILSHKRADILCTHETVANCSVCIPESQLSDYKDVNPDLDYITHPDSVKGLTPKIRWVYDKFPNVMMLDDDLSAMKRMWVGPNDTAHETVEPETAYHIIQHNAQVAKNLGVYFFGFGKEANPVAYNGLRPFELSGFVQGGSLGFLDGFKMVLPDHVIAVSDYWLSGINAYFHRRTFVDKRFVFVSKEGTFKTKGGLASQRNLAAEKQDTITLKQAFGECIEIKKHDSPLKKRQHPYERRFKVPI